MIAVSAAEGYRLWAETWDSTPSPIVAVEERALAPWIAALAPRRALDVGCGTGRYARRLHAIGIDASGEMLAAAARRDLRGRLIHADAVSLPIASASCDLVLCALTLGHIRHRTAALAELVRVLAPGGTLLLSDFHPAAIERGWRRTFRHEGTTYELEHYPYTLADLRCPELWLEASADAAIGAPERDLFARAGRPELFAPADGLPAVLISRWKRL